MTTSVEYQYNLIKQCFNDKEKFLFCMERIHNVKTFSDKSCQLFWKIFVAIYSNGENICQSTVIDVITQTNAEHKIEDFNAIIAYIHTDEGEWQYHLFYIQEQYKKKLLIDHAQWLITNITKPSKDLSIATHEVLAEADSIDTKSVSFSEAYRSTLSVIKAIHSGQVRSMLITGNPVFDKCLAISQSKYILIAAQKKIGKSRFMVDIIDRIVNNNNNIAIQWYSFEMQSDEMIRCFISRKVQLTDRQIMSRNYTLKDDDMSSIESAVKYFEKYPIEFIDEPCDMFQISSKFERFSEQNSDKHCICIIDNLGLIKPHINEQTAFEDDVARIIKNLRDRTKGTIFMLHHLTKESESKWNKDSGYEPKLTHIRGSSRISDFANQVILLHRPDNYDDLIEQARMQGKLDKIDGLFIVDIAANRDGEMNKISFDHNIKHCWFNERNNQPIE